MNDDAGYDVEFRCDERLCGRRLGRGTVHPTEGVVEYRGPGRRPGWVGTSKHVHRDRKGEHPLATLNDPPPPVLSSRRTWRKIGVEGVLYLVWERCPCGRTDFKIREDKVLAAVEEHSEAAPLVYRLTARGGRGRDKPPRYR